MDEATIIVVKRWLIRARQDLRSAQNDLNDDPPIPETACFHAQQCAEKALEAYLISKNQQVERSHYLPRLLKLCRAIDSKFEEFLETAEYLTEYAVTARYPDDWRDIPVSEAILALEKAELFYNFVMSRIDNLKI
ncbi:MAG: HEPN domain-containing protein [Candidatus Electryonea clarkiae]|nr:HEPN domain-containing protein [Candidatus Electryonea clarkiae]MDP8289295.1 HEPN domain-containing protein [Candidatus Electryonea clarkiae]